MAHVRTALFILFATLVVGCQTEPNRTTSETGSVRAAPAAPISTPAMAEVAKADADPSAQEVRTEPSAAPMSTIELQRRLTERGYKPGPIDGIDGQRTINALKSFQHDHKLPVTGSLDVHTVLELRKP
jgi:peptidoglycan hydrolase-like protein with peptidoglycan-binding domain